MSSFQRSLLVCAALVIVLAGVKSASAIVIPFLLSIFIAIICAPLVRLITGLRVPKWLAILSVMGMVVLLGTWLGALIGSSINDFTAQVPQYRAQLATQFAGLAELAGKFNIPISIDVLKEQFDPGRAMNLATDMLSGIGAVMANLLLIVLTVVFILFEASGLPKKLHYALDDPQMRMQQIDRFLESVNRYLAIKTLISLATGVVCGFGLYLIGVDYFILWGVVAFLFNYIPNIGSIIAAVPPLALALIQIGPGAAAATGGLYIGVNMFMGNVIEPRMMGRGLGLSTLVVFLSLIFWGWLLGSVGMLLSVPLTMIVKIGLESTQGGRWMAALLEGEPQAPSQAIAVTMTGVPVRSYPKEKC